MTRRRLAAAVVLGAALYAGALYLVFTADLGEPRALIAMVTVAGLIFTVTGTVAAVRRPDNRTGVQMLTVGLLWSIGALQMANASLPFTLGYVFGGVAFVAFAHLILSYPTGRLRHGDEWIVWAVLALVTVGPLAVSLVDPSPIPGCDDCPESAFLIADRPRLAQAAGVALALTAAALSAFVFVRLVRRYRAATPPLRRVIGPVYLFTLAALVGLVASSLVATVDAEAGYVLEFASLAFLALMPVAFLAGILRTRLARAGIADLVIALGDGSPLRDAVADALGDPSLDLAYWSDQRQAWVDEEGQTLREPIARGANTATFVEHGGKRVAALLHDRSLTDQRELVDAVAATASLAFEKERLQAELRAQYLFLQTIINTAPSLLSVVDTEGRIRNFNRAVEVASGIDDRNRIEGRYFWEIFIDPDEREEMIQRFRDAAPDYPPSEYENVFTDARGNERVIAWKTAPLVDQNGDVVRIIAGGIDITDRKRREVELQRQWNFASTVADTIPSFIVVTDHEAVVVQHGANRAFCDAFGRTLEELEGSSFLELVARDDEFAALMAIAGAANGVPQAERESRWLTRDGRERTVAWTATPILDQWGVPRVLLSGADVTERKRQEAEIRASRSRIVAATDAARRRLERNLHDGAQQRLAALSLSLRLAEAKLLVDAEQAGEILVAARTELAEALEELRELARGLHPNVLTDRGLGPALEALVLRSPIPVEVDVPDERFPPAIEAAAYYVAAEALANVAKYADATFAQVHVVEDEEEAAIVVEVVDDGIGGADPGRGSGLEGLEDRVETLDGTFTVESPPGGGTRVRATIPTGPRPLPLGAGSEDRTGEGR
ncbi:MAG TPA: PAS domain S-box protein [Gaiella sp.]|uniref:PAS domain-containing sensor histidine kinase n=1 Tax=Gaiella sp. TaxID=2663207 RepID=UPI002D8055C6|nr:PAS domain S-box protein [Gaiella sp.]HET9288160.1 PAS domain S-box protein [Gaiella sp.]